MVNAVAFKNMWFWHKLLDQPVFVFEMLDGSINWITYVAHEGMVQQGEEEDFGNLVRIQKEELAF